jgi:DNA-binding beta-propeller fold protein YncE
MAWASRSHGIFMRLCVHAIRIALMKPQTGLLMLGVAALAALAAQVSFAGTPVTPEAANESGGYLLVANKGARALSIVDPATNTEIARVAENGVTGHEVAASPDGKTAYVPIYGDSGVGQPGTDGRELVVIDIASRKVTGTVDFGKGVRPHDPVFNRKDGLLYVTTELDRSVTIVDPERLAVVGSVPTGQEESHMLAISRDGRRGYTANVGPGTLSVLDLERRRLLAVVPVAGTIQRVAISPDDRFVFTADQTRPQLAMIDTETNGIARWIPLPATGFGAAPTPDGRWLVVAMPGANQVAVIDLKRYEVAHVIDVPAAPQEPVIRPDGGMVYVSCDRSRKVAAIRTSDWKVDALIDVGEGADGVAWAAASGSARSAER